MTFIIAIFAFILTIGILVAVHEYGHFWVARKVGVKVLRFSIGFGKPIWTHTSEKDDKVEYVLGLIPAGGYVKMLDEREGDVAEEEKHRAFNNQVLWKRFVIVLAGPVANFLFAILIYAIMYMVGVQGTSPYVGWVTPDSPAAKAGFQIEDKITAINGSPAKSLSNTALVFLDEYLNDPAKVNIEVETKEGTAAVRSMDLSQLHLLKDDKGNHLEQAGIYPASYLPEVYEAIEGRAAAKAGLKAKDKLLGADNITFASTDHFMKYVGNKPGVEIVFHIKRGEELMDIAVVPEATIVKSNTVGIIGIKLGGYISDELRAKLQTVITYSPLEALNQGVKKTWMMSAMTFKVIGRLITGEASIKNISGPITIGKYAGQSVEISYHLKSLSIFLGFIAIVSVSLGVMNLLPVPLLDGGHLLYYIIEFFKGSPVSETVQEMGMKLGVAMVGSLMVLAFYNDILKLMN